MKANDFLDALSILENERGIPKEVIIDSLKEALERAYKKEKQKETPVEVQIDVNEGTIRLFEKYTVVKEVEDDELEISLEDAHKINSEYQENDIVYNEVNVDDFGRLAAIQAKQVVKQKIREIEKSLVYDEFAEKKDEIIVGTIDMVEKNYAIINLGRTGGILQAKNQIPNERLKVGDRIKVYVVDVDSNAKGANITLSRSDNNFLKRLFEAEVPDIQTGRVIIDSIAREAGDRAKMAVSTTEENFDPIGACIGPKGMRVQAVSSEVNNEKIDIIEYSKDPVVYIANALAPAKTLSIDYDAESNEAIVIVPNDQLSLAIGKRGQNVKLAHLLTGYKIDIKSLSQAEEMNLTLLNNGSVYQGQEEVVLDNENKPKKIIKKPRPVVNDYYPIYEEEDNDEDSKPVIDLETLLQDIREAGATPVTKKKIKKEVVEETNEEQEKEEEITFLDVEKPEEKPVVPIYTEEELAAIRAEEEKEKEEEEEYYDEVDYDEYDKYYDE
ncbi:MAG: transcription termination factor NusA [Bacilli bacterium]|jgi:N utilization substance protein A|nr:transcription termination factor NusA [Bacilli bacterium]